MKLAITSHRSKSRISLTPLIDVVFILLLFFMLTSTFSERRIVQLSSPTASAATDSSVPEIVRIALDDEGVSVDGQRIEIDNLKSALSGKSLTATGVLISAAPGVALEDTVHVMDVARSIDIGPISLVPGGERE